MIDSFDFGYSDYIVYVDESGDHSLTSIDPQFPVFALTFCIFEKTAYMGTVVPRIQQIKFEFWGNDSVIMHEADIRKSSGPFNILLNATTRARFYERMNATIEGAPFEIVAAVIDKERLNGRYVRPRNPYEVALLLCMERLHECLMGHGQAGRIVHVVFEGRGKQEDRDLELEFRKIAANQGGWGWRETDFSAIRYVPVFTKKDANSSGLQLADLTARPIALRTLRPFQGNRAFDRIAPKIVDRKSFP